MSTPAALEFTRAPHRLVRAPRWATLAAIAVVLVTVPLAGCSGTPAPTDRTAGGTSTATLAGTSPAPSRSTVVTSVPTTAPSSDAQTGVGPGSDTAGSPGAGSGDGAGAGALGDLAVALTFAQYASGTIEVGSYVAGVIEDGGECRLTAISGSSTVQDAHDGVADASTTSCGTLSVPATSGTWSLTVRYASASGSGEASTTVTVP